MGEWCGGGKKKQKELKKKLKKEKFETLTCDIYQMVLTLIYRKNQHRVILNNVETQTRKKILRNN